MSVFSSRFCRVFLLVFSALRQIPEIVTSSIAEGFAGVAIRWRVTSELRGYCPSAIQAASDLLDPVKRPPTTTIYPRLFAASQQDAETAANEREVLLWLPCLVRMVLPTCGRTPVGVRFFNFFFILFFKLFFCFFTLRKTLHLNTSSPMASRGVANLRIATVTVEARAGNRKLPCLPTYTIELLSFSTTSSST